MPIPQEASFRGERAFLSNFYPSVVSVRLEREGLPCPTVEHAFAASKTKDEAWQRRIAAAETPGQAKRLGRKVPLREDWEKIKVEVMLDLLRQKFTHKDLREKLLDTGSAYLEEGNWWHDNFWGQCTCPRHAMGKGQNMLGKLLMQVRDEVLEEERDLWTEAEYEKRKAEVIDDLREEP